MVDAAALVWSITLSFQVGASRSIEAMRQAYRDATGVDLARSAFCDRLTPALAKLVWTLVRDALAVRTAPFRVSIGSVSPHWREVRRYPITDVEGIDSVVLVRIQVALAPGTMQTISGSDRAILGPLLVPTATRSTWWTCDRGRDDCVRRLVDKGARYAAVCADPDWRCPAVALAGDPGGSCGSRRRLEGGPKR